MNNRITIHCWRALGIGTVLLVLTFMPQYANACAYSYGDAYEDGTNVTGYNGVGDYYNLPECFPGTYDFWHRYIAQISITSPSGRTSGALNESYAYSGGGWTEAWGVLGIEGEAGTFNISRTEAIECSWIAGFIYYYGGGGGTVQITVNLSPSTLNLSTGDTNRTVTTTRSPSITFTPSFAVGTTTNPNSSCQASLSFSNNSGTGSVDTTVTASPAGCSGIFDNTRATVNGVQSNGIKIVVPPQIVIKLLVGEAGAQNDTAQWAAGRAAFNRFGDPDFPGGPQSTWQAVVIPGQFYGASNGTTNGPTQELDNAALLFTGQIPDIVAGAKCFWSPTYAEWQNIQPALQSQTTVYPANVGSSGCWAGQIRQIIYMPAVGLNASGGIYAGAPAFVFLRLRPNPNDPAVVQLN